MFAFGDSLIDNGNNNNLPSFAKANYYPYGIDFAAAAPPGGSPMATPLLMRLLPAKIQLHGVNYASPAAGILDITGRNFVGRIPFNEQIKNFEMTLDRHHRRPGADARRGRHRALHLLRGMGKEQRLPQQLSHAQLRHRSRYNGEQFAELLVQQFARQLTSLYNLGARNWWCVRGWVAMGCIPSMLARDPHSRCSPDVDRQLILLPSTPKVRSRSVNDLNVNLPHAKLIYVDIYAMFTDILTSPASYGFSVTDRACCGIGQNAGEITAAVNIILAKQAFYGSPNVVFPINILQLANLELDPKP
uniref:GDSL esterase/lipase n=1 Tax=Ananas comosus var. bracteatus TaxID=296719 RepID=A0A6V7QV10_ANACO